VPVSHGPLVLLFRDVDTRHCGLASNTYSPSSYLFSILDLVIMEGPAFWYRPLTWPVTYLVFVINPFQNSPPPILTRCQVPSQPRPCFPSVYGPSSACRNIFLYHINFFRPRVLVAWLHHATFSSWPFLAFRKPKRDAHNSYGHDFSLLFFSPERAMT